MTSTEIIITIAVIVLGTVLTRFLPYILFPAGKKVPKVVTYLGKVLAPAVFGLLVVYCFKNVSILTGTHGVPELIALLVVVITFLWKKQMLLSMAAGTAIYMLIVNIPIDIF